MPLHSTYYVTRDIERALGMEPSEQYRIISNTGAYAERVRTQYPEYVFLIDRKVGDEPLDTYALLSHPETAKIIAAKSSIIVFKNTSRIEVLCVEKKWKLLNPSAALAEKIENKITQIKWLGDGTMDDAARYFPPHKIVKISDIGNIKTSMQRPFILQWAHSHTGDGTILIPSGASGEKILANLTEKFPDREARITEYIRGPMFTVNICIMGNMGKEILVGNVSYQITGMLPFTDNPFATVGNDWSLPHSLLSEKKMAEFNKIATAVGHKMINSGWCGLFGIDCIYDEERDSLHLIEINARQPASVTYESELQAHVRAAISIPIPISANAGISAGMTIFEAHIAALTNTPARTSAASSGKSLSCIEINDGAQIIDRIKKTATIIPTADIVENLRHKKYTVIEYENNKLGKPGADHIRIQSTHGIMSAHNVFNNRGKEILAVITGTVLV